MKLAFAAVTAASLACPLLAAAEETGQPAGQRAQAAEVAGSAGGSTTAGDAKAKVLPFDDGSKAKRAKPKVMPFDDGSKAKRTRPKALPFDDGSKAKAASGPARRGPGSGR